MSTIGQRICDMRKECRLTQKQLGDLLKPPVKRQSVCKWELAEHAEIKRDYIGQMASIFHCSPMWLMGFESDDNVTVTYEAPGKESVKAIVNKSPIIGESSKRAKLYKVALRVAPENLDVAIELLESLV